MFKIGSKLQHNRTHDENKKNKFKRKFKQQKQIEKEVPRDNKPTCKFEGSKQLGGKRRRKFKAIRCSTISLNVGFPDGGLTYLKKGSRDLHPQIQSSTSN